MQSLFLLCYVNVFASQTSQISTEIHFCLLEPIHCFLLKLKCPEFCPIEFAYFFIHGRKLFILPFLLYTALRSKKYSVAEFEISSYLFDPVRNYFITYCGSQKGLVYRWRGIIWFNLSYPDWTFLRLSAVHPLRYWDSIQLDHSSFLWNLCRSFFATDHLTIWRHIAFLLYPAHFYIL